jgi:hypothetical protein
MVNPKKKGNYGERYVIERLKKWWDSDDFMKSPESGGLSTQLEAFGAPEDITGRLAGDILTPADFPFCVESKFYAEVDLYSVIRNPENNLIRQWWVQCKKDAERAKKIPMLFFRENRKQGYICIKIEDLFEKLQHEPHELPFGLLVANLGDDWVVVTGWEEFSEYFTKDRVLRMV